MFLLYRPPIYMLLVIGFTAWQRFNFFLMHPLRPSLALAIHKHVPNKRLDISHHSFFKQGLLFCLACMTAYPAHAAKQLEEMDLDQLMKISIVGASKYEQKQKEVAASVSVITRKDIQVYGWRTLGEALASLPGNYITYDRQYDHMGTRGLSLPGDFNTRVLVTINGNRINDAVYDQGPVGREFPLDIDLIERIEFIPGPGSAVYGQNAMLGVVNIITRNGSDIKGVELATSYQTLQSMPQERVSLGKVFQNGVDAMISFSGMQARGQDLALGFGASGISGVAHHMDGENVKQIFSRIVRGPLEFDFIYGNRRKQNPIGAYFSDPLVPGQYQQDRHLRAQIQYNDKFLNESLNVLGRFFVGEYRYDGALAYSGEKTLTIGSSAWHGAEVRLLSTAVTDHKLMLGAEYQNNDPIKQLSLNFDNPVQNLGITSSVVRVGVYAQDEWRITDTLSVTGGMRYDYNKWNNGRLSPRGAVIWQATPKTTIKALYGRAQRAPNAYEREFESNFQVNNPGLTGETIDTAEAVADYLLQPDMNVRLSLYQWDISNAIILGVEPGTGLPQYQQSPSDIITRGSEFSADKTWLWGGRLRGSFGLQDAEFKNSHVVNSPYYLSKLNFTTPLRWEGLRLGYELQYNGKRKTLNGTDLDGYILSNINLMADIKWVKGMDAALAVYNIFDVHYQHPGAPTNWQNSFVQDGRSIRFRLNWRF